MDNDNADALIYKSDEPNVIALKDAYTRTTDDLESYIEACRSGYDARRNIWPGKAADLRKHGGDAFPWDGAADTEAHVIDERIRAYVALFMSALQRANIRAYPVEMGDMARARVVSSFLKWMVSSYIPQFARQMELSANYLLERGIAITYVGWQREDRTFKQRLSLEQLAQISPDLVRTILEKSDDATLIELLKQQFGGMTDKKAKRVLSDLRKTGQAEFPIVRRSVDCPLVQAVSPDGDFFFPAYATDPQQSPYCFWRVLMTAQELRNKIATEGWDKDWVEYVIEKCKADVDPLKVERRNYTTYNAPIYDASELYEVIYGYQRLIDEEDNSEGIYCTVFHQDAVGLSEVPSYAKHELLNGYEDYPVVVTKLSEDNKRLYDVQSVCDILKGIQWQVKVERDSRIDRNSLATLPWIEHPIGNAPTDLRPGGYLPYRRQGEVKYGPQPAYNPGSVEMENTQLNQADKLLGLAADDPTGAVKQQFLISKFLMHVQDVLKMAYKCYQRFGPDSVFFRVTGVPDAQKFDKGNPDENFDIKIGFDVLNNDPETLEAKLQQMVSLLQFDRNGRINADALLDVMAGAIDPILADAVLQPAEQAQQQITQKVMDDLSKIYAGIERPALPNGAQIALQVIQQYVQQPDVMARVQQDEAFRARLEKYQSQYSFMLQQAMNAQIGRVGTAPASMGSVQTQGLPQQ